MKYSFISDSQKRRIPLSWATPIDVLRRQHLSTALSQNCEIEIIYNDGFNVTIEITEANNHHVEVDVYNSEHYTCSCKTYASEESGTCKHIELVKYLRNSGRGNDAKFSNLLRTEIRKKSPNVLASSDHNYVCYNSLKNIVSHFKSKNPTYTRLSTGYFTKKVLRNQSLHVERDDVELPSPFRLTQSIELFDYQHAMLKKMLDAKRAVCGMIMGSGKTLMSIAGIKFADFQRVLIVCPKSVMLQWGSEINNVLHRNFIELNGRNVGEFVNSTDNTIGLCTYHTFTRNRDILKSIGYDLVIADEIQFIRNNESKTWKSLSDISTEYLWGLSGTIIENRLDDLYNVMSVVYPGLLPPRWKFEYQFKVIKSIHRTRVLYTNEIKNTEELNALISENVFSWNEMQLDDVHVNTHSLTLNADAQAVHDHHLFEANKLISKSLTQSLTMFERALIQSHLLKARQACNNNQKKAAIKLLTKDLISLGEKVTIYSEWVTMLNELADSIGEECVIFHGGLSARARRLAIDRFQNSAKCKVFLSSDAGGVGIDGLQFASSNIIHTEPTWNPAKIDQRNGRLNRLGQNKIVNVHYFITDNSIESRIYTGMLEKRSVREIALSL